MLSGSGSDQPGDLARSIIDRLLALLLANCVCRLLDVVQQAARKRAFCALVRLSTMADADGVKRG
jgi:hypothetical protein